MVELMKENNIPLEEGDMVGTLAARVMTKAIVSEVKETASAYGFLSYNDLE